MAVSVFLWRFCDSVVCIPMSRVFLGLGSNQGERLAHLSRALRALSAVPGARVRQFAPIYETEPVGGPPQPLFLNTAVELETALAPLVLLEAIKRLERELGRVATAEHWGPRIIDIDILLYDQMIMDTPQLTIPHPRMHLRRFVLEPLAQLAPHLRHPVLHQTIAQLLERAINLVETA